jgi:hypothetical protein
MTMNRQTIKLAVHELLFSLNIAFLAISLIFLLVPELSYRSISWEISSNRLLQIRQTDLIRGYFEYGIPSIILASCICIVLHLSSPFRLTREVLRSVAGLILIICPPVFWVCYYQVIGWPIRWPYRGAPIEIALAIVCMVGYLLHKWKAVLWFKILLLAGHYGFWWWMPSSNPTRADYAGPIGPILGVCSAVAWAVYSEKAKVQFLNRSAPIRDLLNDPSGVDNR